MDTSIRVHVDIDATHTGDMGWGFDGGCACSEVGEWESGGWGGCEEVRVGDEGEAFGGGGGC